jgi:hypothetical protein
MTAKPDLPYPIDTICPQHVLITHATLYYLSVSRRDINSLQTTQLIRTDNNLLFHVIRGYNNHVLIRINR